MNEYDEYEILCGGFNVRSRGEAYNVTYCGTPPLSLLFSGVPYKYWKTICLTEHADIDSSTDAACFARVSVGDGKKYGLTRETGKAT